MILPFKIDIISLPVIDDKRGRHRTLLSHPVIKGIYKITSPKNGIYIGLSTDIYYRIYSCYKKMRCKQQYKIYNSLKKYGVENHTFEIIHILDKIDDSELVRELNALEYNYIKEFNSFSDDNYELGLNLTKGGDYMELTNETRLLIKQKLKGKVVSEETKEKLRIANTGKVISDETKKKMSEASIGKKVSDETRKKLSESHKGKKQSPETIEKLKQRKHSPETIKKIVDKISGENHWIKRKGGHTQETKDKISETLKGKFVGEKNPAYGIPKSDEIKKKISDSKRGTKRSEESRRKQGDSIRGEKHHLFGKEVSDETRIKLSVSLKLFYANKRNKKNGE